MLPIIIPAIVGGTTLLAWHRAKKRAADPTSCPNLNADQKKIYETALKTLKDPVKLRALADAFDKVPAKACADKLRQRATLAEPGPLKDARRDAFKKAMASKDPKAVQAVATAFQKVGADGAAESLGKYAKGLKAVL